MGEGREGGREREEGRIDTHINARCTRWSPLTSRSSSSLRAWVPRSSHISWLSFVPLNRRPDCVGL